MMERLFKAIRMGGKPPTPLIEYKLKEKFGWTQEQLENESAEDINYYLYILSQENLREQEASGK